MKARRKNHRLLLLAIGATLAQLSCGVVQAQSETSSQLSTPTPLRAYTSEHSGTFNGVKLRYTATVGETILRDETGTPTVSMFSTSYVRNGVKPKDLPHRPVLFLFNGGPGSASMWLHVGAFGPKRVQLPQDIATDVKPPFELIDNKYTVLDVADVVFIDPPETGYSRLLKGVDPLAFRTVSGDAKAVAQFIVKWSEANGRDSSPQYVLGESYGTIRAALVAEELSKKHPLSGVMLVGQAVNIVETVQRAGNIVGYAVNLPALTTIAAYHGRIDVAGRSQQQLLDESYDFAMTDYLTALAQGNRLPQEGRQQIATQLQALTGISAEYYLAHDLVISKQQFRVELLKDRGLILGMYDARYTGPAPAPGKNASDPSLKVQPAFVAAVTDHLKNDLHVTLNEEYRPADAAVRGPKGWDYGAPPSPFSDYDFPSAISRVMSAQPEFRLMLGTGLYDTTTTFGPVRYMVSHSDWPADRVVLHTYEGGHMAYTNEVALKALAEDVRSFIAPR
jgi:carboxypeptidase C (cathepsin A)